MSRDRSSGGGRRAASSARTRLLRGGCSCRRIIPPLQLALQAADQGVFGFKRGIFDPDLRLRMQQLLSHRPRLLQPLHRKRLRIRNRAQQLQLQLQPRPPLSLLLNPAALPVALPRRHSVLLLLLRAASARLLLHDGPHALVGHGGAAVAMRVLLLLLLLQEQRWRFFAAIAWIAWWLQRWAG